MRRLRLLLGTLLVLMLSAALAPAQCPYPIPQAPDMCGPGFYAPNCCGHIYGPGYCVHPPYPPFQGMVFGPRNPCPGSYYQAHPPAGPGAGGPQGPGNGPPGSPTFATHPFARSPRDFFMVYDP